MLIDDLLKRNRSFVEGRRPTPLPAVEAVSLAIVACYDPRLDVLLRPALGLAEGEGFLLRTAGAFLAPDSHTLRTLALAVYLFEVDQVLIVGHTSCRMASFPTTDLIDAFRRRGVSRDAFGSGDLRTWAGAISTPRDGVLASAAAIAGAPFLPPDLALAGAVLDDASGRLELVLRPGQPTPGAAPRSPASEPAPADTPTAESEAASPAATATPAGAPPIPLEALHPALGQLRQAVLELAASIKPDDLRRLRGAVKTEVSALNQLALLRKSFQRAAADSPEVQAAFALLQRRVEGAGHDLAESTLAELFGPLLGRRKP